MPSFARKIMVRERTFHLTTANTLFMSWMFEIMQIFEILFLLPFQQSEGKGEESELRINRFHILRGDLYFYMGFCFNGSYYL